MKSILIAIAAVIVMAGAYYWYTEMRTAENMTATEENMEAVEQTSAGKLDINAVCEGALAYMSFPDGASAELFVEECKEGKHPEVIERYKADMGLGADVAI